MVTRRDVIVILLTLLVAAIVLRWLALEARVEGLESFAGHLMQMLSAR